MKIKNDLITNSSSASFILFIESDVNSLEEFEQCWNKYIEYYVAEHNYKLMKEVKILRENLEKSWKYKLEIDEKIKNGTATWIEKSLRGLSDTIDPKNILDDEIIKMSFGQMSISKVVGNTYSVGHWVSMFNYIVEDVPSWMIHLIVLHNMNSTELIKFGFKNVKLEIQEDS